MHTPDDGVDVPALVARLAELEGRLDQQEAELRSLRAGTIAAPGSPPLAGDGADRTTDRRGFVRTAAAVATGAVVGGAALLADATPAAAANGGPVLLGSTANSATMPTGLAVFGIDADYGLGVTDNAFADEPTVKPAVFGHAADTNFRTGVLGVGTNHSVGVAAHAEYGDAMTTTSIVGNGLSATGTFGVVTSGSRAALLVDGSKPPPPGRGDFHTSGEIDADSVGQLWCCVATGTPGTWRKIGGIGTVGALHVFQSTKRVYDSRPGFDPAGGTKGALPANGQRTIDLTVNRAVPAGAAAVLANLTIVSASPIGYLAAFKNGIPWPGNSTVNWDHNGQTSANSAVVALDDAAQFRVLASNPVDFIVDVVGYYQ